MAEKKPLFEQPLELSENGVLAKLWRDFIRKNNLFQYMFSVKMKQYLNKEQKSISGDVIKTKKKHSIENDVTAGKMTFPVFCHLMFNLMNVKNITITLTTELENGQKTIDTISVPNPTLEKLTGIEDAKPNANKPD